MKSRGCSSPEAGATFPGNLFGEAILEDTFGTSPKRGLNPKVSGWFCMFVSVAGWAEAAHDVLPGLFSKPDGT